MQIKQLILTVALLLLLNSCSSSLPNEQIVVVDRSINQEVIGKTKVVTIKRSIAIQTSEKIQQTKQEVVQKPSKQAKVKIKANPKKVIEKTLSSIKKVANIWIFPVKSKVVKGFSAQHPGITFDTKPDQVVKAVADGVVIYSGDAAKQQGKTIVIRHSLGFYSSYTQNLNLTVKRDEKVQQGKIIALTGKTNFYFQMKKFKTPIDPLKYLQ